MSALTDTLQRAERFLDDIWNAADNRVPTDCIESSYLDQSVRMARSMVATALRILEHSPADSADRKGLVLRWEDQTHVRGGPGEEKAYPGYFVVKSITNSIAYKPGERIDEAQVAMLVESEAWNVTQVEG